MSFIIKVSTIVFFKEIPIHVSWIATNEELHFASKCCFIVTVGSCWYQNNYVFWQNKIMYMHNVTAQGPSSGVQKHGWCREAISYRGIVFHYPWQNGGSNSGKHEPFKMSLSREWLYLLYPSRQTPVRSPCSCAWGVHAVEGGYPVSGSLWVNFLSLALPLLSQVIFWINEGEWSEEWGVGSKVWINEGRLQGAPPWIGVTAGVQPRGASEHKRNWIWRWTHKS